MKFIPVFKEFPNPSHYKPVDLSSTHLTSINVNILDNRSLSSYLNKAKSKKQAEILYGGYLEHRNLYNDKSQFQSGQKQRNIHLGLDFWANEGTEVVAPIDGVVHSFANNRNLGNYGPTIILRHDLDSFEFYSLYGHLSLDSLVGLSVGKVIHQGDVIGKLGDESVNVGYVPHLHFQLVKDIGNYNGDYPGVCHNDDLNFYKLNTIDPTIYFKF